MFKAVVLPMLLAVVQGFLKDFSKQTAQAIWDALWKTVHEAVMSAEKKWRESGSGKDKAKYVTEEAFKFLNEKKKLGFLQHKAFKRLIKWVVEKVIERANSRLGNSWSDEVNDLKQYFADLIPIIE